MTVLHLDANVRCEDALAAIDRDGAVVIDRLVSPKLMDQIASELRPWVDRSPAGKDEFEGRRTQRTGGLIARSPTARELVMNPLVLGVRNKSLVTLPVFKCT